MNLRQLEAFHAVMETGSVTRAGERLGISQPAVSKLLKALRDDCGFLLFHRRGGQMMPTREAQLLESEVAKLFHGSRRIDDFARAIRTQQVGDVALAAPPALAARFLPLVLARRLPDLPDLHLRLLSRSSPEIVDLLAVGRIDLGLSVMAVDHPDIVSEHLLSFPLICLLPVDHPLVRREVIDLDDLRRHSFISLPTEDCVFSGASRALRVNHHSDSRRIEVPMSETAALFAAKGVGATIVPPFVGLDLGDDCVVRRMIRPAETVDLWMLRRRGRAVSLAADLLHNIISHELAEAITAGVGQASIPEDISSVSCQRNRVR